MPRSPRSRRKKAVIWRFSDGFMPGGRFVEEQQPRLVRQGAGDLEPALVAVRELDRQAVAASLEADEVQQAERLDVGRLLFVALGLGA